MIIIVLKIFHILVSVLVVLAVLIQAGKGAGLSSTFGAGGAGEMFFGSRRTTFLAYLTAVLAGLFIISCVALSLVISSKSGREGSIMDKEPQGQVVPKETPPTSHETKGTPANIVVLPAPPLEKGKEIDKPGKPDVPAPANKIK